MEKARCSRANRPQQKVYVTMVLNELPVGELDLESTLWVAGWQTPRNKNSRSNAAESELMSGVKKLLETLE